MYVVRFRRAGVGGLVALAIAAAVAILPHVLIAQGAPPAPTGLAGAVNGSTVTLAWAPGVDTVGPVVYQLEVGSVPGATDLVVATVRHAGTGACRAFPTACTGCASAPRTPPA